MAWGVDRLISDDANDTMEGIFQLVAAGTLVLRQFMADRQNPGRSLA